MCFLCGLLTPLAASAADTTTAPHWLLVQDAASGTLVGTDDQKLKLTLKGVRDFTSAFTDRPDKLSVAVPDEKLVHNWNFFFADSPPNARLSYRLPGSARPSNLVFTLTAPKYDRAHHTITYEAAVVFHTLANLDPKAKGYSIPIPKKFGAASLFIDPTTVEYAAMLMPILAAIVGLTN